MSPYERSAADTASNVASRMQEAGADVRERAESAMHAVSEQGSRAMQQAERTAEDAYYATRRFVQEQPLLALAGVTAFAFLVGALWRIGANRRRFGYDLVDRVTDYMQPQSGMRRRW
jgi:ElaB/YqjD/DUF883 family membrane-anchored ribosome-binding protein